MKKLLLILAFAISGCESNEESLARACEQTNGLCEVLKPDPRCLSYRKTVVIGAADLNKNYSQRKQYYHMIDLERYVDCAERSTWISYKDLSEKYKQKDKSLNRVSTEDDLIKRNRHIDSQAKKKNDRLNSYVSGRKLLAKYSDESIGNTDPYSLYWHWTRNSDTEAIKKLIKIDREGGLNSYDMKYYLSQEFIKNDLDKTLVYLLDSLRLYPEEHYLVRKKSVKVFSSDIIHDSKSFHYSIFKALSTIYFKKKDYDNAYVFSRLLDINEDDSVNFELFKMYMDESKFSQLDKKAEHLHNLLKDGKFKFNG